MANLNEEARIPVYINDEQAKSALKNLQQEADKWRKKMFEAMESGNMKGIKDAERELKNVNKQMSQIKREAFDVNKVLENIADASTNDLKKALQAVNREMEGLKRSSQEYQALMTKKNAIRDEFAKINGTLREQPGLFTRLADGANKYFNIITLGIATLTGVVFSIGQFVKGMVGLDDALADVMKTTGLTRREVREMYSDFKFMNTRTPRKELLALAEEAGRLGKTGKRDIQDFVEVANKIKISLGDDLGGNAEEAIREVGKLTEIYKVGSQYGTGFKESMEKVGSGLNQVANNSNASASYLIEYLKREGGVAVQAKISAADIMGYASTFDQLGQNVEMAATAQSKVLVDMFTDPAKYARIAKMEVGDFSKLLKTDANEAFIRFLEGLNGNNEGLSEMAVKLDGLGIDGARATQALAALSSNTKMLRDQQVLANDAMDKGISLNNEYQIKNNNMAGSWERLTVWIHSKFINSGFLTFLEKIVGKTAELIDQPVEAKLRAEQAELNVLVAAYTNANSTVENKKDLIDEIQKKYPDFLGNLNAEKVTNEELQKRLEDVNKQYEDKILLMIKEDKLLKNYKERTELKLEELDLIKQIAAAEKIADEARKKITPGMDANSYRTVLTQEEFNALNNLPYLNNALQENRKKVEELKQSENDLNAALGELRKNRTDVPTPGSPTPTTPESSETQVLPLNDKDTKKAYDAALKLLDEANNKRMASIIAQYEKEAWTDEKFKSEQLSAELAYLTLKKALAEKYNQDTTDIDGGINQKRVDMQKSINEVLQSGDKALYDDIEGYAKEVEKSITDGIKIGDKAVDEIGRQQNREKEILEQRQQNYLDFAMAIGEGFGELMNDSEATFGDYLKKTLEMALEAFHQFFLLEKYKAIIQGISGGLPGALIAVGKVAAMEVAYQAAKALILKGFASGGYTGPGGKYEVAGVVHKKEYVIPEEGTDNPGIRPFIDIMEIARQNGSLARLDLRPVMMSVQSGKSFSSGGPTSDTPSPAASVYLQPAAGLSSKDIETFSRAVDKFEKMKLEIDIVTVKKKLDKLTEVEDSGLR